MIEKEVSDALHVLLHCALKDKEYETQKEQFNFVYEYILKLENNWNELKKWLEEQKEFINDIPTFSNDIKNNHMGMVGAYNNSLDKMQELESGVKKMSKVLIYSQEDLDLILELEKEKNEELQQKNKQLKENNMSMQEEMVRTWKKLDDLQQIEQEHQKINGELRGENKKYKEVIDKAIEYCDNNKEFAPRLEDVLDILKEVSE